RDGSAAPDPGCASKEALDEPGGLVCEITTNRSIALPLVGVRPFLFPTPPSSRTPVPTHRRRNRGQHTRNGHEARPGGRHRVGSRTSRQPRPALTLRSPAGTTTATGRSQCRPEELTEPGGFAGHWKSAAEQP